MDKVSYALGMSLGNNLLQSGITTLDYARLAQGIQDVMEHRKPEISYQEAQTAINDFFRALQDKAGQKNREEGQAFLAANARRPEVVTLPSGLQYEVVREAPGPMTNPPKPEWSSSPPLLGIFLFTPTKSTFKLSATNCTGSRDNPVHLLRSRSRLSA